MILRLQDHIFYFKLALGLVERDNVATTTASITNDERSRAVKEKTNTIKDSFSITPTELWRPFKVAATAYTGFSAV